MLYTAAASLIGIAGYYLLLELWLAPHLSGLAQDTRLSLMGAGVLTGVILALVGTGARNAPSSYLTFLLPPQTLKISISPSPHAAQTDAGIFWLNTSIGDVSYDALHYRGWEKTDYELVLTDPSSNLLEWTGRTGEEVTIMFSKSPQGGVAEISWNGTTEVLNLSSEVKGKYPYTHNFAVPFYASKSMALLLITLNFIVVCFAIILLIWEKRIAILNDLSASFAILSERSDSRKPKRAGEDAWSWGILGGIVVLAFLLRVFNLENLNPYIDEYAHLIAAKQILEGAPLHVVYQRSLFLVTLPVAFFFRIFGAHLWAARLVGVLVNTAAIIPLYLLAGKINKPVAVLACILYATNPWIISVSRNVREYGYYPFFFYLIVLGMIIFVRRFPDHFVVPRDWRKLLQPKLLSVGLLLILPVIYSLTIDPTSTFQIILVAYGVFGLYLLTKIDFKDKTNILILFVVIAGIVWGGYYFLVKQNNVNVSLIPKFNAYPLRYFFANPQQQWYFDRLMIIPAIAFFGGIFLGFLLYRSNFVPSFFFSIFAAQMLFFMVFFNRNIRPRYIINAEYWFLVLVAIGLYGIWIGLRSIISHRTMVNLWIGLALLVVSFNPGQVLLPALYDKQGYMPITEEYHYDVKPAYVFLLNKANANDALISSVFQSYVLWTGKPVFKAFYHFNFYTQSNPQDYILSLVSQNDAGWIVLDNFLYGTSISFPRTTVKFGNKTIEYIGTYGDQYIWKWNTNPSN